MLNRRKGSSQSSIYLGIPYVFTRAPMGLEHTPNHFQALMDSAFADLPQVIVYVDNVLIITEIDDPELHVRHVLQVIERCNEIKLRINAKKFKIMLRKFISLGHQVSSKRDRNRPIQNEINQQNTSSKFLCRFKIFLRDDRIS